MVNGITGYVPRSRNRVSRPYLSPDPLLQNPSFLAGKAGGAISAPSYAYASNNPLLYVDLNGLDIDVARDASQTTRDAVAQFRKRPCGKRLWDRFQKSKLSFIIKDAVLRKGDAFTQARVPLPAQTTGYALPASGPSSPIGAAPRSGGAIIAMDWSNNTRAGGWPWFQPRTIVEALAHELFHAAGLLDSDRLNGDEDVANDFGKCCENPECCK